MEMVVSEASCFSAQGALNRSLLGLASIIRWMLDSDYGGIFNVTPKSMDEFNAKTPNNPAVQYFSWAGQLRPYQVKYL